MTADSIAFYLAQGQYDAMAAECEQDIAADPESLMPYWYLGLARLLQGDEAEAQAVWFAATTIVEPEALEAGMVELIVLLETEVDRQLAQGRPDLAERLCWQLLEIDSEQATYHLQLGQCVALQAKFEEAIDHWQTALTLQPDCAIAYQKQGEVFQALAQWDEAVAAYQTAIELQPSWKTHYQLGVCLGQQARWQEALTQFDQVIQLHPSETVAYGDRGWALLQMGNWQAAIADFKWTARSSETIAVITQTGEGTGSLSASARSPITIRNTRFFHALHTLWFRQSEHSESNVSESNHPELAIVFTTLGQVLAEHSQWERSIEAYRFALQHHPSAESWTALGKVLALSEPQAAIEAYERALQEQPNFAEASLRLGQLLVLKNRDRAIQLFQTAMQLQPGAEGYVLLARWATEDPQKKITLYRQALTLQPDRIDALLHLSYALAETGDLQGAIAGFQRVLWLQPSLYKTICAALEVFVQKEEEETNRLNQILSLAEAPTGCYETTQEWVIQASEASYLAVDPPHLIELTLPKGIDRETHVSFRFGREIQLPETFVVTLPKGQFWLNPAQTSSAILTADHQLLGDLSPEFPLLSPGHPDKQANFHSLLQAEIRSPIQSLDGTIAVLSGLTNQMYFHWMFDVLPKFYLLQRAKIDLSQIDGFVVSANLPFQQETLRRLEIPNSKILETNQHSHIQADRLIVPSYPGSPAWMPKWACEWLRSVFLKDELLQGNSDLGNDRLYISRQDAANRRVINELEIVDLLTSLGFQCITLEGRSVQEQANLFATASVIISPHGGGLTNTVFCRPGTKVIELFAPNYVYPCYWLVSNLLNLDYYYLTGKTFGQFLTSSLYADARLADIWIDREELTTVLSLAKVIG
jgi:tetratricopeptide (TPR) repeat protein/capsular polysaccharide biosynthesis protein